MRLPNVKSAFINLNKLRNYSLNPERDRGKYYIFDKYYNCLSEQLF